MSKLNAKRVNEILLDCLFKDDEMEDHQPKFPMIEVNSVILHIGFHKERLESHRSELIEMVKCVPDEFTSGGGSSFLNLCMDKDGTQWGEHHNVDEFIALCDGLKLAKYPFPREMWDTLPGGMPYIVFVTKK